MTGTKWARMRVVGNEVGGEKAGPGHMGLCRSLAKALGFL